MPDDDSFDLWLGRIGSDRPFAHRVRGALNRAGGIVRRSTRRFTGVRIGRGAGIGRLLASRAQSGLQFHRRVIVKARIVRLGGMRNAAVHGHLRYLQRDGTTRTGQRGELYGPDSDHVDGKAFLETGQGDRHQFRFIVAPEDGAEYDDLKPLIRRWMKQAERDLGTRLDWVAVDHFNTGHPHSHVIVRGKDQLGKNLVIAREYLTHGLHSRAEQLVDLDLGPRSPYEVLRVHYREMEQERFTGIDRRLIDSVDADGLVRPTHRDSLEQSLRAGRLQTLGRMGLATEERRGVWRLDLNLEDTLRRMGERNDIIRTLQQQMRERLPGRALTDLGIFDPATAPEPLVGKVVARGLSDELAERQYLIVDGIDGIGRYVDIGAGAAPTSEGSVVRIAPVSIGTRLLDRTVAEIAEANGGLYSRELHLRHDPGASEAVVRSHVRRLEAIERATGSVERVEDGSWAIASDHIDRCEAYERRRAARQPVTIETLADRPLAELAHHDGVTWLDEALTSATPPATGGGFGAEVRRALESRRQWLIEQGLADADGETVRLRGEALAELRRREWRRTVNQLGRELGLGYGKSARGERIEGLCRRQVRIGGRPYALIEKAHEFTLVPWRPALERALGKEISGIVREAGSISWTVGHARGLGLS
ncbi:MAG TPA: relaxase/mobilization nuclease RlxS [Croceibacterium sp.]|nr:relaxase/mobilization nuclease RlxS [Croceibacterium sp.]